MRGGSVVVPTTWNALFLGNFATEMDSSEGDAISENASAYVGQTFGGPTNKLAKQVVSVTAKDFSGTSGAIDVDNNSTWDELEFDLGDGAGTQSIEMDGMAVYSATITYVDGTTANISAVVIQDDNGNMFLAPEYSANADSAAMEAKPIESLTLNSLDTNNSILTQDRLLTNFVCFAAGTRIQTPDGERRVETLDVGDVVSTLDSGPQPIHWRSCRQLDFRTTSDKQKPVEFKTGALGAGTPETALRLSPQHRILLNDDRVGDVLVPALWLIGCPKVRSVAGARQVVYHTLMLRRHEVIFANGAAVESFLPGPEALRTLTPYQVLNLKVTCPWATPQEMSSGRIIPKRKHFNRTHDGAPQGIGWQAAKAFIQR